MTLNNNKKEHVNARKRMHQIRIFKKSGALPLIQQRSVFNQPFDLPCVNMFTPLRRKSHYNGPRRRTLNRMQSAHTAQQL